jgi:hypothetical protein
MKKIKTYLNNNIKCILVEIDPQNSNYQLSKNGDIWYLNNGQKKEGIILNEDLKGDSIEYVGIMDGVSESKLETLLKSKDVDGHKIWYDYQKSVYNPELKVMDSYKTFLDKNGIVWSDIWGLITITKNKKNESKINEDDGGGGAAAGGDGGGSAYASQGSIGGMGDVVSAQPGAIPGTTGTTGSGDVGFPFPYTGGRTWSGPSPSMMGKRKRKNMFGMGRTAGKGSVKIEKPTQKVMSFDAFYKSTVNNVTHVKESNTLTKILFTIPFLISLNIVNAQCLYKKNVNEMLDTLPAKDITFLNEKYNQFKSNSIKLNEEDKTTIDNIRVSLYNIAKSNYPYFTAIIPLTNTIDAITDRNPFGGTSLGIRKKF